MTVGNLDRRIQIQTRDTQRGTDGSLPNTWTTVATVWAKKRDRGAGREAFTADQLADGLVTEWTIRWRSGMTGTERIIGPDGVIYNAIGVPQEVGRREYLIITAERGIVKA